MNSVIWLSLPNTAYAGKFGVHEALMYFNDALSVKILNHPGTETRQINHKYILLQTRHMLRRKKLSEGKSSQDKEKLRGCR
jgi:hypothetical protein